MQRKIVLFIAIVLIMVITVLVMYYGRMEAHAIRDAMQKAE